MTLRRKLTAALTAVATFVTILAGTIPALAATGELTASESTMEFGDIHVGTASTNSVFIENALDGVPDDISITNVSSSDPEFAVDFSTPVELADGDRVSIPVTYTPTGTGDDSATLTVTHDGTNSPIQITLNGGGMNSTIWHRVNAGSGVIVVSDTPNWVRDSKGAPSPYLTAVLPGTYSAAAASLDSTVPGDVPSGVFNTQRSDGSGAAELAWSFPVDNGAYEARLFFAETFHSAAGDRIMDVTIEGMEVLADFDVFAEAGDDIGTMRSFLVDVSDGTVDINLKATMGDPMISGIEIFEAPATASVAITPDPLAITAEIGSADSATATFENTGTAAVRVTGVSASGTDAADFDPTLAAPVWVAPGGTVDIEVTFNAPATEGDSNAQLVVDLDGSASVTADLVGTASSATDPSALGASTGSINFGNLAVGADSDRTVTLTNNGSTEDITISAATLGGSESDQYTVSVSTLPAVLSPGESLDISVGFAPDVTGAASSTLRIDHNGSNTPLTISLNGTGVEPGPGFTDTGNSVFQTEIDWLAAQGITKGCNPPVNSEFCPTDVVTRGQMAAFLHRALDDVLTPGAVTDFTDDDNSVFEADIEWLGATGVTKGCNPPANTEFCPDDPVTRGQMAAFLHRALDDVLTPGAVTDFTDDDNSVFEADIEWLGATGVTKGCNPPANTEFCPDDPVTREQMAAFLYRALGGSA